MVFAIWGAVTEPALSEHSLRSVTANLGSVLALWHNGQRLVHTKTADPIVTGPPMVMVVRTVFPDLLLGTLEPGIPKIYRGEVTCSHNPPVECTTGNSSTLLNGVQSLKMQRGWGEEWTLCTHAQLMGGQMPSGPT